MERCERLCVQELKFQQWNGASEYVLVLGWCYSVIGKKSSHRVSSFLHSALGVLTLLKFNR